MPPPPFWGGGAHPLAKEGLGESQFRRGDIHCGTLYSLHIRTLCCRNNDQAHADISSKKLFKKRKAEKFIFIYSLNTGLYKGSPSQMFKIYQCTKTSFQSSHQCMFALIGSITYAAFTVNTLTFHDHHDITNIENFFTLWR